MKKLCHLYNNILIVGILLIVFGPPGALAHCGNLGEYHAHIPSRIGAIIGACLDIPCLYDYFPGLDRKSILYAIWLKHIPDYHDDSDKTIFFNSSGTINTLQMELTGNVRNRRCDTRIAEIFKHHENIYMLNIENDGKTTSFCGDPIKINVVETPWAPTIAYRKNLRERQVVTVNCSATTPCSGTPPELTWNLNNDSIRQYVRAYYGNIITRIQYTIDLTHKHDGFNISCSAKYPVKGGFKQSPESIKTLSVSYSPKDTKGEIKPNSVVSVGSVVELFCRTKAKPRPRFIWMKAGKYAPTTVSRKQAYRFIATPNEDGEYYCEVKNPVGHQRSKLIRLIVASAPRNTTASITPRGLLPVGTLVDLTCTTIAERPFNFTWFRSNKDGTTEITTNQFHTITASPAEEGDYYCVATNRLGNERSKSVCVDTSDIPFTPSLKSPVGDMKEGEYVTISCSASTPCPNSPPELTWNLKKDSFKFTEKNTNGTFTTKIQETMTLLYTHHGYNIKCSARHPANLEGKPAKAEATITVLYSPKLTSAYIKTSGLLSEGNWVELICSTRSNPPPKITWFKKGPEKFSEVAKGIILRVKFTGGNEYYCEAENELGKQRSSTITLRLKGTMGVLIFALLGVVGMTAHVIREFVLDKWSKQTS